MWAPTAEARRNESVCVGRRGCVSGTATSLPPGYMPLAPCVVSFPPSFSACPCARAFSHALRLIRPSALPSSPPIACTRVMRVTGRPQRRLHDEEVLGEVHLVVGLLQRALRGNPGASVGARKHAVLVHLLHAIGLLRLGSHLLASLSFCRLLVADLSSP